MSAYLTAEERAVLLRASRDALEACVGHREPHIAEPEGQGRLAAPGACFVTLYANGELRGCIGGLEAQQPLAVAVRTMTAGAALRDPRFSPVLTAEAPHLRISLSVLTPMESLPDPRDVEVGRDGLVIERGNFRGVLLPQVASERGWDGRTFLEQTCRKAGLPPDAWMDPQTSVLRFSAEVFGEP